MKFRPTEFLNTPYRVSCYIKLYRKLFSVMRPIARWGYHIKSDLSVLKLSFLVGFSLVSQTGVLRS